MTTKRKKRKTKTTTQEAVLAALRRTKRAVTSQDVAERLGASERAVRRHLAALWTAHKATRYFAYVGTPPVGRFYYRSAESS